MTKHPKASKKPKMRLSGSKRYLKNLLKPSQDSVDKIQLALKLENMHLLHRFVYKNKPGNHMEYGEKIQT